MVGESRFTPVPERNAPDPGLDAREKLSSMMTKLLCHRQRLAPWLI